MRSRPVRWLLRGAVLAFACVAILAYGYWRAWSRAHVYVNLVAVASDGKSEPVFNAELIMRDLARNVLAEGKSDARFGIVRFVHPQLGSCEEEENSAATSAEWRARWDNCIGEKFRWQAGWAPRVGLVDIRSGHCQVTDIPLTLRMWRQDWWLWWVPLPHVGGDPLTEYNAKVSVNAETCQVRATGLYE
jgi:hypothetical protein